MSSTAERNSRPRISTYTQPDSRAFSLRSIGGPSLKRSRAPRSLLISRRRRRSTESRISRG